MNYDIDYYKDEVHCLYEEKKELQEKIDKAIRILNSAKNHYDNDKTNWAIERTLRVLKGSDDDDNSQTITRSKNMQ